MPRISEADKQDINSINEQVKDIRARRKDPRYHMGDPNRLAELDAEEEKLIRRQQAILAKYRGQGDPNLDAFVRDFNAEDPDEGLEVVNGDEPDMSPPPAAPNRPELPSRGSPSQPAQPIVITKQQYLKLISSFGKAETDKMIREAGAKVR